MMTRTEHNLWSAFLVEAKANTIYIAYAQQTMAEGQPEAAAAGYMLGRAFAAA
jgi:rubrerythrin